MRQPNVKVHWLVNSIPALLCESFAGVKLWHGPYKCIIRNISVKASEAFERRTVFTIS